MASGSVIKGSGFMIIARMVGMVGSFLLFLLLTWRSKEMAGVFRTSVTFLTIMESLPLLGMHRWLSAEIAREADRGAAVFSMAVWFAVVIATLAGGVYMAVAFGGLYPADVSACLKIVALATIPSALYLCVISALVGIGFSYQSGVLVMIETIARSLLSIVMVLHGVSVFWVVVVFAVTRWMVAGAGLVLVYSHLPGSGSPVDRPLVRSFLSQVPNLAVSMIGFLAIRNAAILLLPWLRSESEVGLYAAPFQLFDVLLLVPTVLTISANFVFVESARRSISALRRNMNELLSITAMYIFPLATIASILARPGIEFLFGTTYEGSVVPFRVLLLCAGVMSIDQVMSLSMVTAGRYGSDRVCIVGGAVVAVVVTGLLSGPFGAVGAAIGLLAGSSCTLALRFRLMGDLLSFRALGNVVLGQALPSVVVGVLVWVARLSLEPAGHVARTAELVTVPIASMGCLVIFYVFGGLSKRQIRRIRTFMAQRG